MYQLPNLLLDPLLRNWLIEDIGRGDRTALALQTGLSGKNVRLGKAQWIAKESGIIAGLAIAARAFHLLDETVSFIPKIREGKTCPVGPQKETIIADIIGPLDTLLTGERVALNIVMRLSGIATLTHQYVSAIADTNCQFVDTRKTTPGLRILEKYATVVGGAKNHRMGLDDAVMIKDNHIIAAGGIPQAIEIVRANLPFPLTIEVETENLAQVAEAIAHHADIIMLDNMPLELMREAVSLIRSNRPQAKIEASGNITLETIHSIASTGVDYISSSAPITRSHWLDISMRMR